MKNEISDYLRMIDDADNAHSPTSRAAYADALIDVLRDIFTDEEIQALAQAKADGRLVILSCKVGDTVYFTQSICEYKHCDTHTPAWLAVVALIMQKINSLYIAEHSL